jgi:hypothetical protein
MYGVVARIRRQEGVLKMIETTIEAVPELESRAEQVDLVTVPVAASRLTLAEKTVWGWIGARRIGVVRVGRCVRIPTAEIRRIIREGHLPALRSS